MLRRMSEVTQLLNNIESGDSKAAEELLPLVYDELRKLATWRMAHEPAGHTLQATALVHEAYLRLIGQGDPHWQNSRHFFSAAAEAMRRILIDRARKRLRERHGAGLQRLNLDSVEIAANTDNDTLLRLNDALEKLTRESPAWASEMDATSPRPSNDNALFNRPGAYTAPVTLAV